MEEDIYNSGSNLDVEEEYGLISTASKVLTTVCSLIAMGLYSLLIYVVPNFEETFDSFGADLPLLTSAFLISYPVLYILLAFSFLGFFIWISRLLGKRLARWLFKISVGNAILSFLLLVAGMQTLYLPILNLGV